MNMHQFCELAQLVGNHISFPNMLQDAITLTKQVDHLNQVLDQLEKEHPRLAKKIQARRRN